MPNPNDLLERMALPYFDDRRMDYTVHREDVVETGLKTDTAGAVHVIVIGYESSDRNDPKAVSVIEFRTQDIVKFPEDRTFDALEICNQLNRAAMGQFILSEDGELEYRLKWILTVSVRSEDFGQMLNAAVSDMDRFYSAIMSARWANPPEDDDDILSDDDIRRLME